MRLRLPTPQCAPNFAFLMAADARAAVWSASRGCGTSLIELEDHYTGDEINAAVVAAARSATRSRARPGASWTRCGRCSSARRWWRARGGCCRPSTIRPRWRWASCPGRTRERCRELRLALGIDASDDAPAFVTGDGTPVTDFKRFRRLASLTALSLETNGGMCRDLLRVRYSEEGVAA